MSHFTLETDLQSVIRMDAPLTKGPQMRWQRKQQNESVNMSCNESISNCSTASAGSNGKTPKKTLNKSTAKTPHKTPRKTPGKGTPGRNGSKTPSNTGDRFIPSRSNSQFDLAHHLLMGRNNDADNELLSPSQKEYRKLMAENLNGTDITNSKIITYKNKAPNAPEGYQNNLKVLYSQNKTPGTARKTTRQIPQVPERILDAPDVLDDYYLNLLSWSCNNHLAVCLGSRIYLWDASSGDITELLELEGPDAYVSGVSFIKEGNILAVGTSSGEVQLWDVATQKRMRSMGGHVARVGALSWNNYILSTGSRSGAVHHHDVRVAQHQVGTLLAHSQEVCGLQWSPDGRMLASGGNDNMLHIWDAQPGSYITHTVPKFTFSQHQAAVKALAWCPWQPSILASGGGTADRNIRFWNCNTGALLNSVDTKSQVCALLWNTEYKELVSSHGFADNQLILWKYPTMTKVAELTGHTSRVLHMALSPDGTTVVSAAADETLRLWKCFQTDPSRKKAAQSAGKVANASLLRKGIR